MTVTLLAVVTLVHAGPTDPPKKVPKGSPLLGLLIDGEDGRRR